MTIAATRDWRRLIREASADLPAWHERWMDIDWPQTLAQAAWHLITDHEGSWCLLEPSGVDDILEAHLIIAKNSRGKRGWEIARDMLAWIETTIGVRALIAKAPARHTQLFLRRLGFRYVRDRASGVMIWKPATDRHVVESGSQPLA